MVRVQRNRIDQGGMRMSFFGDLFDFNGALTQLGECHPCKVNVMGSNPICSIDSYITL